MDQKKFQKEFHDCLVELSTEEGINASSKDEVFGCVFGRDSAITILKMLRVYKKYPSSSLLDISRKGLLSLVTLQGEETNIESGEEPGKFIHEYRTEGVERFLKFQRPWFVYPDGFIKNYDSLDSTPLALIALYRYFEITQDQDFLNKVLPSVKSGLCWIIKYGDKDKDGFLEYELVEGRTCGGLNVQSWTDSHESIRQPNGDMPKYPIAPVEVQSYAWLALKLWADYFLSKEPEFACKLNEQALALKQNFNEKFLFEDGDFIYAAQALDGHKQQIRTITGNPLICLWASYKKGDVLESIVNQEYLNSFVGRAFQFDLFDETAGIRTMSSFSPTYNPNQDSYHNGSFWPVLNGLIHEGLQIWGYRNEALKLKQASLAPIDYFGTPVELYIKNDDQYLEYCSPTGQIGCRKQAWSAAALLDLVTEDLEVQIN